MKVIPRQTLFLKVIVYLPW